MGLAPPMVGNGPYNWVWSDGATVDSRGGPPVVGNGPSINQSN